MFQFGTNWESKGVEGNKPLFLQLKLGKLKRDVSEPVLSLGGLRSTIEEDWNTKFESQESLERIHKLLRDPLKRPFVRLLIVKEFNGVAVLKKELEPERNEPVPPPPSAFCTAAPLVSRLRLNLFQPKEDEVVTKPDEEQLEAPSFSENAFKAAGLLANLSVEACGRSLDKEVCEESLPSLFRFIQSKKEKLSFAVLSLEMGTFAVEGLERLLLMLGMKSTEGVEEEIDSDPQRLGAGTHGVVYSTSTGIAVKKISLNSTSIGARLSKVFSEITALSILRKAMEEDERDGRKHVVQMKGFTCIAPSNHLSASEIHIFMDRADCNLLEWRAHQIKRLDLNGLKRCLDALSQVARGIQFANEGGIVHYDIRCENILVFENVEHVDGEKENVRFRFALGDFGEAHCGKGPNEYQFSSRGTESIKAPEMLRVCSQEHAWSRDTFDRRRVHEYGTFAACDMWSFGCLIYELLTKVHLYSEAFEAWATFFLRLNQKENLPLVPEEKQSLLLEELGDSMLCDKVLDLMKRFLVVDPLRRPTAEQAVRILENFSLSLSTETFNSRK